VKKNLALVGLVVWILCIVGAVSYGIHLNAVNGGFMERGVVLDKYQAPSGNYVVEFLGVQTHSVVRYYISPELYKGIQIGQMYECGGENKTVNWYEIPYDDGW
jgi:hypothetical protein